MLDIQQEYKKDKIQLNQSQEEIQVTVNKLKGNRRRSHIHFIHQYKAIDMSYTGTRVVVFIKGGKKFIYDTEGFVVHQYKNPKLKSNEVSSWNLTPSNIFQVTRKEMLNYSIDDKYKMRHILYESPYISLENFAGESFEEESIAMPTNLMSEFLK